MNNLNDIYKIVNDNIVKDVDNKKYYEYEEEIKENIIFGYIYFGVQRDESEYKYIPKSFLENDFFISRVLIKNPDIYYYLNNEKKEIHKELIINTRKDFIKYLNKEDIENKNIKYTADVVRNNYKYISANEIHHNNLIKYYYDFNDKIIREISKQLKLYFKDITAEEKIEYLNKNNNFISVLELDDKVKNKCIEIVTIKPNLFKYLKEEWKNDMKIIKSIIYKKSGINYYHYYYINHIDINKYLNEFKEEMENNNNIHLFYEYYNKEVKYNKEILLNLFKSKNTIGKKTINQIPDVKLRSLLIKHYEDNKKININLNNDYFKIVEGYFLDKELRKELESKDNKKVIKI